VTINVFDIFCCCGGASMGYHLAGCNVVGADIFEDYSQKSYPFRSFKMDWHDALLKFGRYADLVHTSPPCQRYSITNAARKADYPDLVGPVREALIANGKPWVIENVLRAPLIDPVELCGCMFNLTAEDDDGTLLHMWRPRIFETSFPVVQPVMGDLKVRYGIHAVHSREYHAHEHVAGSYGGARRNRLEAKKVRKGGYVPSKAVQQRLMGIDWTAEKAMHQAIPPVYTKYIAEQFLTAA
jgi:DNA (cytosine-5)-methyltransferase 1